MINYAELLEFSRQIRRAVLEQSKRANVGHIGSSLSVADIIAALYVSVLDRTSDAHPDRDRFVLSKGHAALALYAAFHLTGRIDKADLDTYCGDGTRLGVHPEHHLPGVDFSTGSLGHGLSIGVGAALAAQLDGSRRLSFVLLSDAECNEGSVWEAAMFAGHHRLANLVALVDLNGQQALGYTKDILSMDQISDRWSAFGWRVLNVDGNDPVAIAQVTQSIPHSPGPPHVILAQTTFGKGVSFMEHSIPWHYLPMTDSEFDQAIREVEKTR